MNTRGELLLYLRAQLAGIGDPNACSGQGAEYTRLQKMINWVRTSTVDETDPYPQSNYADTVRSHTASIDICRVTERLVLDCEYCQGRACAQHDGDCHCTVAERHGLHPADAAHVREVIARRMQKIAERAIGEVARGIAGTIAAEARSEGLLTARPHMSPIVDQPPPVPTDHRPCWDIVIEHTRRRLGASAYGTTGIVDLVIADMSERDRNGRAEYGVPLTSGNGRDHLVDAYQEALDLSVYLVADLDEYGIDAMTYPTAARFDQATAWHIKVVQRTFHEVIDVAIRLRAMIAGKETPK